LLLQRRRCRGEAVEDEIGLETVELLRAASQLFDEGSRDGDGPAVLPDRGWGLARSAWTSGTLCRLLRWRVVLKRRLGRGVYRRRWRCHRCCPCRRSEALDSPLACSTHVATSLAAI